MHAASATFQEIMELQHKKLGELLHKRACVVNRVEEFRKRNGSAAWPGESEQAMLVLGCDQQLAELSKSLASLCAAAASDA